MKFRLNCRTILLTYKGHILPQNFDKFKGFHKICWETGETGYKHTHALMYYRKKYDTKDQRYFDLGNAHPNIKKILTKTHWANAKDYLSKDNKVIKDTLTGNEYLWNGEARDAIQQHNKWRDVINDESLEDITMKHLQWAKECYKYKPKFNALGDASKLVFRKWQKVICQKLWTQNDRQILWVCGSKGAEGKSWLTDYLLDQHDAIMFNSGKVSDMAKAFEGEKIVIFDLPKSSDPDFTPYRAMEMFKDGRIFSPKYDSGMKRFKKCKVIVFSNELPNKKKLIADRWDIFDLAKKSKKVPTGSLNIKGEPKKSVKITQKQRLFQKSEKLIEDFHIERFLNGEISSKEYLGNIKIWTPNQKSKNRV